MADRKTWAKRVAAWRASGMTCREYAESEGLGAWRTLRYWAWRLEREQQAKKLRAQRMGSLSALQLLVIIERLRP
jgi:hypothetical protein